jgi:hypothetical protein
LAAIAAPGAPRWVRIGAIVLALVLAVLACRIEPWGPEGFGPSVLAPCLPLLAAMASGLSVSWVRVGAILSIPVVVAHGAAVFEGGHTWDERRVPAQHPEAVWDFRDSPLADLVWGSPPPDPASFSAADYLMRPGDYITRAGRPAPWLVYGWEALEDNGVWASGAESWIVVATPPGDYVLTFVASAPRVRGRLQRLSVERPEGPPIEVDFTRALWQLEPLAIPFHAKDNLTILRLRPAHTSLPGHGDVRRCSFFLAALRLAGAGPR